MSYALVVKDDVRDVAVRWDAKTNAEIRSKHAGSSIRIDSNDMTYEVCFAVGLTQLRVGARGVVFESPLGRVALGERAVAIFKEAKAFCVLVDCFAERAVWEARLAAREPKSHRPRDAEQIMTHYAGDGNMQYEMKSCDAHVSIDCGRPTHESVRRIKRVIETLIIDETGRLPITK